MAAAVHHRVMHKEGKDPLSVDLYANLCLWFLQWVLWRVPLHTVFSYCLGILHAGQTTPQTSNSTRFLGHRRSIHLKSTLGTRRLIKQEMMQSIHAIFTLTHCALLFAQCLHCCSILHVVSTSSRRKMTCCFQDPTSANNSQTTLNASFHSIQMR